MLEKTEISGIMERFGLTFREVTALYDTSRSQEDKRLNYILDDKFVLKVASPTSMWEERLQEISRLIGRYRSIGIYCPALIPTSEGPLSCQWEKEGRAYTCFVEEFAIYPVYGGDMDHDRREVVEHLGVLAAKYTDVDLSDTRSMWSIIDLAPLDAEIDEKQENTNALVGALKENGFSALAQQLDDFNRMLRERILRVFDGLPRCVFQGDLNSTNELHRDGHFAGLIDFNLSGTDVNINVFLNETNEFPEEEAFDSLSVRELLEKMERDQDLNLSVIFRHYTMNETEKYAFPYYRRITDLFQYPNVCMMVKWLRDETRRSKCVELIRALIGRPL